MPKKTSSKTPTQIQENPNVEQPKPSSTPKKFCSEIDEIFAGKKRKKAEQKEIDKEKENEAKKPKNKNKKKKKSKEDKEGRPRDPPSGPRRKTNDGFNVYTEEELGVDKANAGGTPLCPFDCDCCF